MMKLGVLSHLLVVLTPAAAQFGPFHRAVGPFHSAVDDFGQMYFVSQTNPLVPVQWGPYQSRISSTSILEISKNADATHIIFAVSNLGRWTRRNPAMFILSSDPAAPYPIISDASWFCKGYIDTPGVTPANWPKDGNAGGLITIALTNEDYTNWHKAVELSPNFSFIGSWGTIENIPLEANFIWAAGLEPNNSQDPPRNVICIKSLG